MKKYAYLARLEELLAPLPAQEREDALNYYEEYFDAAGKENEERTAAELGDPAEVAQKILEGEGLAPEATDPAPAPQGPAASQSGAPEPPEPAAQKDTAPEPPQPPAAPEPPALDDPDAYPQTGTERRARRKVHPAWIVFWVVIIIAALVQLCLLLRPTLRHSDTAVASSVAESAQVDTTDIEEDTASAASSEQTTESQTQTDNTADNVASNVETIVNSDRLYTSTTDELYGIEIDASSVELKLVQGTSDSFEAVIEGERCAQYQQELTYDNHGRPTYHLTGGEEYGAATTVTLTMPKDSYHLNQVQIAVQNGSVYLGGELIASDVTVQADGPVTAENLSADSIDLQSTDDTLYAFYLYGQSITLGAPNGQLTAGLNGSQEDYYLQAESDQSKVYIERDPLGNLVTGGPSNGIPLTVHAGEECSLDFNAYPHD